MKTFILASLSLIAVSCAPEPMEDDPFNFNNSLQECGTVKQTGEASGVDFIVVQRNGKTANNYEKYKVGNYQDYKINSEVCNLGMLTKLPY